MREICSKWLPRLLTVDQKQQRVDDSERCLELFQRNKKDFFMQYVTMDETWIHHYTLESNRQSAEWTARGGNCPKRPKPEISAGKVLASLFWDAHSILFTYYHEREKTIKSEYYIALLVRLKREIATKTTLNEEERSSLPPKQCTVSQVDRYNGKIAVIAL